LDCLCGIIKLPIAQTVPTVTKEIAIMAMILFSNFVRALYSEETSLNFYWTVYADNGIDFIGMCFVKVVRVLPT
jgi:hypothetical protein